MKKVLSLILAVAMLASVFAVSAFAADGDMEISLVAAGEVKPGGVVTMDFAIANNPGVIVVKASLVYDASLLTCESYVHNDAATGLALDTGLSQTPSVGAFSEGLINIVAGSDMAVTNTDFNGSLGTVTFRVADTVTAGQVIPVQLNLNSVVNADGNDVENVASVSNGITVADVWTAASNEAVAVNVPVGTSEADAIAALVAFGDVTLDKSNL